MVVSVFLIFGGIIFSPSIYGLEENGIIEMPFTENPPSIDGKWTTEGEWSDAAVVSTKTEQHEMFVMTKHDRDNVYVMINLITDQFSPLSFNYLDYRAYVGFDTNYDTISKIGADDFFFGNGHVCYSGKCSPLWKSEVWIQPTGERITDLQHPSGYKSSSGFTSKNDPYEAGRDHRVYEFSIPISFLHSSDIYGFKVETIAFGGATQQDSLQLYNVSWPAGGSRSDATSWGAITAPQNTVTAPPVPFLYVSTDKMEFGNVEVSKKSFEKSITITNKGTALLKISSIKGSSGFSVLGIDTPTNIEPNESQSFQVVFAPITTGEKAGTITISSNDLEKPKLIIQAEGTGVEPGTTITGGGGCLIATATYGSELAPQVQLLREIRDLKVLKTESGSSFMHYFNEFYYSFSPTVADLERQNPMFKESVKVIITPLLYSLSILNYVEIGSEDKMMVYGIGVILLNLGTYLVGPIVLFSFMKDRFSKKSRF